MNTSSYCLLFTSFIFLSACSGGSDDGDTVSVTVESSETNPISVDSDRDGLTDDRELELGLNTMDSDTDADGFTDFEDQFPNDSLANSDIDNDGVSDARDAFINDASETADLNGDGLGDNAYPIDGTIISGTVSDIVTGTKIADAQISLDIINTGSFNDAVVQSSTDGSGSFSIIVPNELLPDSFALVVSSEGYRPEVGFYSNNSETAINTEIELIRKSPDFTLIESSPNVHHVGDDIFDGTENSQFQRSAEGLTLRRNFNVTATQANSTQIMLRWVAKGIQFGNDIVINDIPLAKTAVTDIDGAFQSQSIALAVEGILVEGSNTIEVKSEFEVDDDGNDYDDFEFVFIGLTGLN